MAGTTNLLQWNPTASNQETDAQYLADSQRSGGATNPSVFEAELANKAFFQWSTYLTALFQAFANKGYTTSDSNLSSLTAQCANFLTSADVKPVMTTVAYSPTPTFNCALANGFRFELGGNVTASTLINVPPQGVVITFFIVSQSPGNYFFVWPGQMFGTRSVQFDSSDNLLCQQFVSDGSSLYPAETFLNVLATRVTAAQSTASSAASTASTALSNAANAQGTANTAVSNAAAAQSTANTAVSNAAAAQSTANTAVSNAAAAQGTASTALTNANTALSEIAALHVVASRSDVTAGRAFGVTYTNSTGYVLFVTGYGTTIGGTVGSVQCFVSGDADFSNTVGATVDGGACGFSFVVPAGATYSVAANTLTGARSGVTGLGKWIETAVAI